MKLFVALCVLASAAARPSNLGVWNNKTLVRVSLSSDADRAAFQAMEPHLDMWKEGKDSFEAVMSPRIAEAGLKTEVVIDDLRAHFEEFFDSKPVCEDGPEICAGGKNAKTGADPFYEKYQDTAAIFAKMDLVGESEFVSLFNFGTSYEGRPLRGFKITGSSGFDNGKKVAIYNCGTHAREWIPVTFCVYVIDMLAQEYGVNANVTSLLDEYEVHSIPILNPDGYEYTHTTNNMWRKSRKPNPGSSAVGTDLNRNFEYQWGTGGSSSLPNSDSYMGQAPADNVETVALQEYWKSLTNAVVQMDIHSYGNMWMYPMGYLPESLCRTASNKRNCGVDSDEDYEAHETCGLASKAAVSATHGYNFDVGPIPYVIYQASGSTCDYAYAVAGIRWAYAIETRGPGFQPPTANILLSCEELYAGIIAQMQCISTYQ
jgi:hypothetical protein